MAKQRITYSKNFKRKALLEVVNGADFKDILRENGFEIDEFLKKDKKYCSKLLYKWKKEIYQNREFLYFANLNLNNEAIEKEISYLSDNNKDYIMQDVKKDVTDISERYNNLKTRAISLNSMKIKNKYQKI